jgi:hypothetical protein
MTRILFVFLMLFVHGFAMAQNAGFWNGTGIEVNYFRGKIFKHTKKILAPVPPHSSAIELNFVQQTFGHKAWHKGRNYPVVGFAIAYTDYGADSTFGKCTAIYPSLQLPILRLKNVEWTFRAAFGLGYATKRFERYPSWDTLNTAIGSHFNNYSFYATDIRYRINEHWDVQAGGNFSHISNAAFRQHNRGVNMYGYHVGLRYFPVSSKPERINTDEKQRLRNRLLGQVRLGISANELSAPDGPLYPIYLATGYASWRYAGKNKLLLGVDYSYHSGIYAFLRNNEIETGKEKDASWKSSVYAAHEFLFGRTGIVLQFGWYLKQTYIKTDNYYQKMGGNYYFIQNEKGFIKELYGSILLKTHKAQAELVEMGLGFGF